MMFVPLVFNCLFVAFLNENKVQTGVFILGTILFSMITIAIFFPPDAYNHQESLGRIILMIVFISISFVVLGMTYTEILQEKLRGIFFLL